MRNKTVKISRGYRLKSATHKLIKNLEALTECDTDTIISASCKLYLKAIVQKEENNYKNKIINLK